MDFFKRWLRPISFFLLTAAFILAVVSYLKKRNYSESFERKYAHRLKSAPVLSTATATAPAALVPQSKPVAVNTLAPEREHFKTRLQMAVQAFEPQIVKCTNRREEILADKNLIDPNYNFYRYLDNAVSVYDSLFNEALIPEGTAHIKVLIEDMLRSRAEIDPAQLGLALKKLDYCLRDGTKAYAFIDTLFESMNTQAWPLQKQRDLKRLTLGKISQLLDGNSFASATQLAVSMSLFDKLVEYGLLIPSFPDELNVLKEKIIESERLERDFMSAEYPSSSKRELLLQQIEGNRYLQSEMMEIVRRELERLRE